jgi:hypothetical protein
VRVVSDASNESFGALLNVRKDPMSVGDSSKELANDTLNSYADPTSRRGVEEFAELQRLKY